MNIISYKYYSTMLVTVSDEKQHSASMQISTYLSDIIKQIPVMYQLYPQVTSIEVIDLRTKEILINHHKNP